jgi:site-specific recombinase XerD
VDWDHRWILSALRDPKLFQITVNFLFMDIQILHDRFCKYSRHFKGFSPETLRRYQVVFQFFIRNTGVRQLMEVDSATVRAFFLAGRTQRNWSAQTFRTYHKSLSVFFQWCLREGCRSDNPLRDLELPKIVRNPPPKLTKQAAGRLLEVVYNYPFQKIFLRARNHAILAILIYAGLRKGELLHLAFAEVDVANLSLFVRRGKGAKDRSVPISTALAAILQTYLRERRRMRRTCPEFFASSTSNRGMSDSALRRLIGQVREASGISFSAHQLRHTFATLMLEGGCDIYSLSTMMGHSNISSTTIYLAASAEHLRGQMSKHPLNDV